MILDPFSLTPFLDPFSHDFRYEGGAPINSGFQIPVVNENREYGIDLCFVGCQRLRVSVLAQSGHSTSCSSARFLRRLELIVRWSLPEYRIEIPSINSNTNSIVKSHNEVAALKLFPCHEELLQCA